MSPYQSGLDNLLDAVVKAAQVFVIGTVVLVLFFAR